VSRPSGGDRSAITVLGVEAVIVSVDGVPPGTGLADDGAAVVATGHLLGDPVHVAAVSAGLGAAVGELLAVQRLECAKL